MDNKKCFEFLPDFLSDEAKKDYFKEIYTNYINDSMYDKCIEEGISDDYCKSYKFEQKAGKKHKYTKRTKRIKKTIKKTSKRTKNKKTKNKRTKNRKNK
jgi:hypothetical protein